MSINIHEAVDDLARAAGVKARIETGQRLRRAVASGRREPPSPLQVVYVTAMKLWDADKADGVGLVERVHRLTATIRAVWPTTRDWKYLCQQCDDTGLVAGECPGDATCGRSRAHLPHAFGRPCWCDLGRRFKDKPKPSADDAVDRAAKTKGFTKAGRF